MNLTARQLTLSSELYSARFPRGERETETEHVNRVADILFKHLNDHGMMEPGNNINRAGMEYLKDLLGPERLFRFWVELGKEN